MGRLLTFLARAASNGWGRTFPDSEVQAGAGAVKKEIKKEILGCAISEHTWVAIDGVSGVASFHGVGPVYLVRPNDNRTGTVVAEGKPLTLLNARVLRWNSSSTHHASDRFSFKTWQPVHGFTAHSDPLGDTRFNLSAVDGVVRSTAQGGGVYGKN